MSAAILAARGLGIHAGGRELVRGLDLELRAGECVALLGRNGAGKTLTLHALAGLQPAATGSVLLDGQPLDGLPRRAIARRIGVLLQDLESGHSETALDTVLVGRHPHLAPWQWERDADRRLARSMLTRVGLGELAARATATLSGGEQRRIAMATLLTQQPALYLLDEPTNHLDPHHQLAVLDLFREQAHGGRAVLATLHDPTLAARYADRVVLLYGDGRWLAGDAREVLTPANLSDLYLVRIAEASVAGRRVFVTA
ncbi:MAG: hemin import ATP-binding protein HmuV [Steroidobacteraceae bacterium]|nr:ABC transporter ATP-binding protein [Burkholderiaceae bacterium]